jgi:hypothetical protein
MFGSVQKGKNDLSRFEWDQSMAVGRLLSGVQGQMGKKKPPDFAAGRLCRMQGRVFYIVSMKLRSLSLRLGCLSLRSALASI